MTANAKRNRLEETATKTPEKGSIPLTRSTSPPFILNGLQLRWKSGSSDSHKEFNEPHLRYDVPTLCSDLCASVAIVGFAAAVSAKDGSSHCFAWF